MPELIESYRVTAASVALGRSNNNNNNNNNNAADEAAGPTMRITSDNSKRTAKNGVHCSLLGLTLLVLF
jgi:hypothetical protein